MIYVDLDDVVAKTCVNLASYASAMFNKSLSVEDMVNYDLKVSFKLNLDEYHTFMKSFHDTQLQNIEAEPYACETINFWKDAGHTPVIVTGRPTYSNDETRKWLDSHNLKNIEIIHVDKYGTLFTRYEAPRIIPFPKLKEFDFKFAIDDAPNAINLISQINLCPVILFDRPWNKSINDSSFQIPISRVHDWLQIKELSKKFL